MISQEKRLFTRKELSVDLLNDEQFIGCLAFFLHALRLEKTYGKDHQPFITPGRSAGMTAADRLLRKADQAKEPFRSPSQLMTWLGPQLENVVPQVGLSKKPFTQEDVELLREGLVEEMDKGLLGLEGFSPIMPVNELHNMLPGAKSVG